MRTKARSLISMFILCCVFTFIPYVLDAGVDGPMEVGEGPSLREMSVAEDEDFLIRLEGQGWYLYRYDSRILSLQRRVTGEDYTDFVINARESGKGYLFFRYLREYVFYVVNVGDSEQVTAQEDVAEPVWGQEPGKVAEPVPEQEISQAAEPVGVREPGMAAEPVLEQGPDKVPLPEKGAGKAVGPVREQEQFRALEPLPGQGPKVAEPVREQAQVRAAEPVPGRELEAGAKPVTELEPKSEEVPKREQRLEPRPEKTPEQKLKVESSHKEAPERVQKPEPKRAKTPQTPAAREEPGELPSETGKGEIYYIDREKKVVGVPYTNELEPYRKGVQYQKKGAYDKALESYLEYLSKCEKCASQDEARFRAVEIYLKGGREAEAMTHLDALSRAKSPELRLKAHLLMADLEYGNGNLKRSIEEYEAALDIGSGDSELELTIERKLGDLYYEKKEYERALSFFEKRIKSGNADDETYFRAASICESEGPSKNIDKAYRYYRVVVDRFKNSVHYEQAAKRVRFFDKNFYKYK